jgi:anti-sigma factor RsiW
MDETLRELVSRYADGDLDDAESSRLEARAETDPEVAAEITTITDLRTAVGTIAGRMEPPAALDRVMEPLRQAPPVPAQRARPVYRWLGIAAAVVLGVTVATEMARRNPTPTLSPPSPQQNRPVGEREEIFKLAPLPTAVPNDNRPLGAVDQLLEEEPAIPAAPEPAPLEVMGPLNTAGPSTAAPESLAVEDTRSADDDGEVESRLMAAAEPAPAKSASVSRAEGSMEPGTEKEVMSQGMPTDGHRKSKTAPSALGTLSQDQATGRSQRPVVSVLLLIDDVAVWTGSSASCQNGRWPVRIEVEGNLVSAIEPVIVGGKDRQTTSCTPDAFIGSSLEGVGNGVHLGELIVGEPPK